MPDEGRRYSFGPLERRGVLLGLQVGQVGTLLGGAICALVAARAVPAPAGPVIAVLLTAGCLVGALWPAGGRPLASWVPVGAGWVARRAKGPVLDPAPRSGQLAPARAISDPARSKARRASPHRLRPAPLGIDLVEVAGSPGQEGFGVAHDLRSGSWAAVVPVQGASFALMDADEQVRRLEAWRAVLGTLARAGTPLRRIQWVQRSAPASGGDLVAVSGALPASGPETSLARDSYRELVAGAGPVTQSHHAWMVLAVGGIRRPGAGEPRTLDHLRREVRLLAGQLRNADLRAGPPLSVDAIAGLIAAAHEPVVTERPPRRHAAWPMATDEPWSAYRADGTWHATYWIGEWPRLEVNPDFLTPLLIGDGRRAVSVIMSPVPADRAAREARSARAADVADEELRARAGFLPSAQRGREAAGVVRREVELADGHAEYRFSGYVTVTAPDRPALEVACLESEQAAQRAHLELRRLYGRQAEAYTWTLPLGRGLA